ncbi:hypothetical protein Tco_1409640 [Tanacetum coccineum]
MTDDEDNDEHVTRRIKGFFFEPVTKKRTTFPKCYYSRKPGHKIEKCCEYMRDLKIAKRERASRKARHVAVMIACANFRLSGSPSGDHPRNPRSSNEALRSRRRRSVYAGDHQIPTVSPAMLVSGEVNASLILMRLVMNKKLKGTSLSGGSAAQTEVFLEAAAAADASGSS